MPIDQGDNKVEPSPSGITLDAVGDIKATARGMIALDAVGAVTISSESGDGGCKPNETGGAEPSGP